MYDVKMLCHDGSWMTIKTVSTQEEAQAYIQGQDGKRDPGKGVNVTMQSLLKVVEA